MFLRKLTLAVFVWFTACAGLTWAQTQSVPSYVFGLPGATSQGPIYAYTANPFSPLNALPAANGAFLVLGKPDASKFYVISNSGGNGISELDPTFSSVKPLSSPALAATGGAISPNGSRLIVVSGSQGSGTGTIYIYDTGTDALLLPNGITIQNTPVDDSQCQCGDNIAISLDSKRAMIVGTNGSLAFLTTVDLTSLQVVATLQLPAGQATGIAMAPNGYAYVTAYNRVWEVDPNNPTVVRTEIQLNGVPNKMVFTSDGAYGLATNRFPSNGSNILMLFDMLARKVAASFPSPAGGLTLDQRLVVAGSSRIFATSNNTLYEITNINPLSVNASGLVNGVLPSGVNISAIATSNEVPTPQAGAHYLFVVTNVNNSYTIYRVDLTQNGVSGQFGIANPVGGLSYATAAPTTGAATILPYNNNQTVQQGATSQPLIVRVLDASNRPVWNVPVTFSSKDVTIQNPTVNTSADGFAQVTVVAPGTAATFTVTATVATSVTATFNVNVPGAGGGGPGGPTGTGTTSIVSGNGQLIFPSFPTVAPISVLVKDTSGNPVANTPVTFTVTQGGVTASCNASTTSCSNGNGNPGGNGSSVVSNTDSTGVATISALGSTSLNASGIAFEQSTITATSLNGTVNISIVTTTNALPTGASVTPSIFDVAPSSSSSRTINAQAGQTIKGAIAVQVIAYNGQAISGVALNLINTENPMAAPPARCSGGTPLTDTTGTATCDLIATGKVGTFSLGVDVGNFNDRAPVTLTVTPGAPGLIQIVQGNNQSGAGNSQLPLALVATVSDGFGNVLPGTQVTWSVSSGTATLVSTVSTADTNGHVSTLVKLGNVPGTVQIKVAAGGANALYSETVNVTIGGISAVSGGGQTGFVNQTFANPLVVLVSDQTGAPLSNSAVTFAVTSGSGTLSSSTGTTDTSGHATVKVSAGPTPGTIVVTATAGTSSTTFTLTSRLAGPQVTAGGFVSAASAQLTGLVPCGDATLNGTGLAPGLNGTVLATEFVGVWPTSFQGVTINIGGTNAPIYAVSNVNGHESVTFQTPCELTPGGTTSVTVTVNGGNTSVSGVQVLAVQPGLFEYSANGTTTAVAFRPDGTVVSAANPAHYGETVRFIVTGLGAVTPPTGTNSLGVPGQQVMASLIAGLANSGVTVTGAEYLTGSIGLYDVSFVVPAGTPTGYQPLALAAIGADGVTLTFGNGSQIPIAP